MLHAIVMAGGAGTRFWPASRRGMPKQLLSLGSDRTMIQATLDRLGDLVPAERTLIVTNRDLVTETARQLPHLPPSAILGEPCKRDTAPCVGLAAALVAHADPDATMLVLPADHVIATDEQFRAAVRQAVQLVERSPGRIVTFGIRPTYPAETYGYIERGEALADSQLGSAAFRVARFREKPSAEVAREYLATGRFYWNAGIFVWKAGTIRDALGRYEPEMAGHLTAIAASIGRPEFAAVLDREFAAIRGKSIDYAVLERSDDVAVIEAPFAWDDVGNWQSLARLRGADADGNTLVGRHLSLRTQDTIVRTDDRHLVVTVGLKDCIVVHTPDATLVANRHDEESLRQIVALLQERGWTEYL